MAAQADRELTIEEKSKAIENFCKYEAEEGCFMGDGTVACPLAIYKEMFCYGVGALTDEKIIRNYDTLLPCLLDNEDDNQEEATVQNDPVNHPEHYTNGGMECIDEMIMVSGVEAVKHFCVCNAWKYRYRAMSKGGKEDLEKADWYLHKYKELTI